MKGISSTLGAQLKKPHFGLHLTYDGYGGDYKRLNDKKVVLLFLEKLVRQLEMKKLIGPYVVHAKENDFKDPGGYTGFVVVQESHISIHTFPKRGFVSIDAYSCKDYDFKNAINFITSYFKVKKRELNVIVRGKKYPAKNLR